jgi:hypothetical protein
MCLGVRAVQRRTSRSTARRRQAFALPDALCLLVVRENLFQRLGEVTAFRQFPLGGRTAGEQVPDCEVVPDCPMSGPDRSSVRIELI